MKTFNKLKKTVIIGSFFLPAFFLITVLLFPSCEKDDTTPPNIALNGSSFVQVALGKTYKELGATASDKVDGYLSPVVTGYVNTAQLGNYIITYSVIDAAGNTAKATRTVNVYLSSGNLAPNLYNVSDTIKSGMGASTIKTYVSRCSKSLSDSTKIYLTNFGNFASADSVTAVITPTGTVTIASQQLIGTSDQGQVSGQGYVSSDATNFYITYTFVYSSGMNNGQSATSSMVFSKK